MVARQIFAVAMKRVAVYQIASAVLVVAVVEAVAGLPSLVARLPHGLRPPLLQARRAAINCVRLEFWPRITLICHPAQFVL